MSNEVNYKPLINDKIKEFFEQNPEYTYGQLMYSVSASLKGRIDKKSDFLNLTDEDFYTGLDLALKREQKESDGK